MNQTDKAFGVVIVGAGDMGAKHAQNWHTAGAKVIAVCDPDIERAKQAADPVGADAIADYKSLLSSPDVHAASVCTPTFLHTPIAIDFAKLGKHVLIEKPIALTLEQALSIKEVSEETGAQIRVGFMRRFDEAFPKYLDYVKQLDGPILASAVIYAGIRPKILMHNKHANGGPVIDMCCHVFDMWAHVLGAEATVEHVDGYIFSKEKQELTSIDDADKAIDSVLVKLSYPNGNRAQLHVSWGLPSGIPTYEHHTYTSAKGVFEMTWDNADVQMRLQNTQGENTWRGGGDSWKNEIAQFYAELSKNAPQKVASTDDGIKALKLSLDIIEKAERSN